VLPEAVKVDGFVFRTGPVNSPQGDGYLPDDLLAARNVACAHISMARKVLALTEGRKPGEFKHLLQDVREEQPDGSSTFSCTKIALTVAGITCQNGREVISAVFDQLTAANQTGEQVSVGKFVVEDNAHAAAFATALQLAREVLAGCQLSIRTADLDRLQELVDKEAWCAADRRAAGAGEPGSEPPAPTPLPPPDEKKPSTPSAQYCLLPPQTVRWEGQTEIEPLLWHLLEFMLKWKSWPIEVGCAEEVWGGKEVKSKTIANTISRLNAALEPIAFPWTFRVRSGYIMKD